MTTSTRVLHQLVQDDVKIGCVGDGQELTTKHGRRVVAGSGATLGADGIQMLRDLDQR